jgi:hypothetical protein
LFTLHQKRFLDDLYVCRAAEQFTDQDLTGLLRCCSQAQRRFRERQKSLIGDLRESVSALTRETEAQSKQIFVLQAR